MTTKEVALRSESADLEQAPRTVPMPPTYPADVNSPDSEVTNSDVALANFHLLVLAHEWGMVDSFNKVCKLIDQSIKTTIHRRHLLGLSYGSKGDPARRTTFEPLD